jgi:ribonuclease T1
MVRNRPARPLQHAAILGLALMAWVGTGAPVHARSSHATTAEISVADLPGEGREVLERIHAGGPFRYSRDGVVFGNREHRLPAQSRGYYREYTVTTPGSHNRGARRIICGGAKAAPAACWYTDDHYESFRRIVE